MRSMNEGITGEIKVVVSFNYLHAPTHRHRFTLTEVYIYIIDENNNNKMINDTTTNSKCNNNSRNKKILNNTICSLINTPREARMHVDTLRKKGK